MATADDRGESDAPNVGHLKEMGTAYIQVLERVPPRPLRKGNLLIEYRMPGAAAFYMGDGEIIQHRLAFSDESEALRRSMETRLGAEIWQKGEALKGEVNTHLAAVVRLWTEIGERIAPSARQAGLLPLDRLTDGLVDYYWPALFVDAIWREAETYDAKGTRPWEGARLVEDIAVVPMRHTLDTVTTWIIAGTNMVRSQSRASVELMRRAWEEEARWDEPIERTLSKEHARIESEAEEFKAFLERFALGAGSGSDISGV